MSTEPHGPLTVREAARDLLEGLIGNERGLWHTLRRACLDPVSLAAGYVDERSLAPVRPLRYLIGSLAVYSATVWWLLDRGAVWLGKPLAAEALGQQGWILQYAGLVTLVVLPTVALILHLLSMRRLGMMMALSLLAYVNATVLLAGALLVVPCSLLGPAWLSVLLNMLLFVYVWVAFARALPPPRWRAGLLGLLALVLGQVVNTGLVWAALRWIRPLTD